MKSATFRDCRIDRSYAPVENDAILSGSISIAGISAYVMEKRSIPSSRLRAMQGPFRWADL